MRRNVFPVVVTWLIDQRWATGSKELGDYRDHFVLKIPGELRKDGYAEAFPGKLLGNRTGPIRQIPEALLLVQGQRIVDFAGDLPVTQVFAKGVPLAIEHAKGELVPSMPAMLHLGWQDELAGERGFGSQLF